MRHSLWRAFINIRFFVSFSSFLFFFWLYSRLFCTESRRFYLSARETFAWRCSVVFTFLFHCFFIFCVFVYVWCLCVCVSRVFCGKCGRPLLYHCIDCTKMKVVGVGSLSSWWSVGAAAAASKKDSPHGNENVTRPTSSISSAMCHVAVIRFYWFRCLPHPKNQFYSISELIRTTRYWMHSFRTEQVLYGSHHARHQCVAITATVAQDGKDDRSTQTLRTSHTQNTANASMMEIRMNACQLHQL